MTWRRSRGKAPETWSARRRRSMRIRKKRTSSVIRAVSTICAKCSAGFEGTAIAGETIERIVVFIYYLRHIRNQYSFYTIAPSVAWRSLIMIGKFNFTASPIIHLHTARRIVLIASTRNPTKRALDWIYIRRHVMFIDWCRMKALFFFNLAEKVQKKYQNLGHKVLMVTLDKDRRGLGISLAGHKDRNRMAVFICGLNPKGAAYKNGGLLIGDEILEVDISYSFLPAFMTRHLRPRFSIWFPDGSSGCLTFVSRVV